MQTCPKCKIRIRGNKSCCPLCQGALEGAAEAPVFPVLPQPKVSSVSFFRLCLFASLLVNIVMFSIAVLDNFDSGWPLWIAMFALLAIADLFVTLYFRYNLLKLVTSEVLAVLILCYMIDRMTGFHRWSIIWVIPAGFLGLMLATTIIARAQHLHLIDYVIYIFVDLAFSLTQLIPILHGHNTFRLPAVISMAAVMVYAAWILVFRFGDLKRASGKWLNL